MNQHTKRVVILFSLLVSISLLTINSYGQGGSAEKTPPQPSTKQPPKSSQPVKRSTTSSKGSRSTSATKETDNSSPTLNETLDFIKNKMEIYGKFGSPPNALFIAFVPLDKCKVQIRRWNPPSEELSTETYSLSDINPMSVKISAELPGKDGNQYFVQLRASDSKKVVDYNWPTSNGGEPWKESGDEFDISDSEAAKSIVKALQHAVKLCGGKPDPF